MFSRTEFSGVDQLMFSKLSTRRGYRPIKNPAMPIKCCKKNSFEYFANTPGF